MTSSFGSSAFGQVHLYSVRDAEVAGSNPAFPTKKVLVSRLVVPAGACRKKFHPAFIPRDASFRGVKAR